MSTKVSLFLFFYFFVCENDQEFLVAFFLVKFAIQSHAVAYIRVQLLSLPSCDLYSETRKELLSDLGREKSEVA